MAITRDLRFDREEEALRGVRPFLAARSMPLNGLTPVLLSVSRYATHPRTPRARARGCCTRRALMSHDCIQIPSFFFHASALFHRARERSVSLSRFFCRRWKWRLLERDATWRNERDREHSFFLLFLLFFNTRGRKFYWRKVRRCRMTLIFWCIIILERVYIDKSRRLM